MSLAKVIGRIIERPRYAIKNEANTIDRIVLPILKELGWDVFHESNVQSEVAREYFLGKNKQAKGHQKADIVLLDSGKDIVCIIEAKAATETLNDHTQQLFGLATQCEVEICVLTNGWEWKIYLKDNTSLTEVAEIVLKDNLKEVVTEFDKLLREESLLSGSAVEYAKEKPQGNIITDTDESEELATQVKRKSATPASKSKEDPRSFMFLGKEYYAKGIVSVPRELLSLVYEQQPDEFFELQHESIGSFVSSTRNEFNKPEQIADSQYYFEKDVDTLYLLSQLYDLIYAFDYEWKDLVINYNSGELGTWHFFDPKYDDCEVDFSVKGKMIRRDSTGDEKLVLNTTSPKPIGIIVLGEEKVVKSHIDVARAVCEKILEISPEGFSVYEYMDQNRTLFVSTDPELVGKPGKIAESDFYLNQMIFHYPKNQEMLDLVFERIMSVFGYTDNDYSVNLKSK